MRRGKCSIHRGRRLGKRTRRSNGGKNGVHCYMDQKRGTRKYCIEEDCPNFLSSFEKDDSIGERKSFCKKKRLKTTILV